MKSVENTGKTNLISENGKIYFLYSSPFSQKKEAPGTAEGFFFILLSHFSITADTTVILRLFSVSGGTFSRPTVYYLFKVGRLSPGSYCHSEPAFCRAAFICVTAFCQVTVVPSTFVASPVPLPIP